MSKELRTLPLHLGLCGTTKGKPSGGGGLGWPNRANSTKEIMVSAMTHYLLFLAMIKTSAELTSEEKNKISHRGMAVKELERTWKRMAGGNK